MKTLRQWRRARLISIEDLAKAAGVSTKTIVGTELGRSRPKFRTIRRLCDALKVEPTEVSEFAAVIEERRPE
jgi:transcriptional regulator with XRE-family HTH domain